MRRDVELLCRRVREELRAEGPDGAGYSDFIVLDAINSALDDLSEMFPIRDVIEFTTTAGENTYDLETMSNIEILDLIRVEYDSKRTTGKQIDSFLDVEIPSEGAVREWFLWGNNVTFVGEIEADKAVKLWVTRAPKHLREKDDAPETPRYADEALIAYAVSVCYRESKDYERANYHYSIYLRQKNSLLKRGVPQGQRDHNPLMRASYGGPFRPSGGLIRSDFDPGGSHS